MLADQFLSSFLSSILRIVLLLLLDPINVFCLAILLLDTFGYVLILTLIARVIRKGKSIESDKSSTKLSNAKLEGSRLPMVSFIIPAHNEEETIERKLENTYSLNYPKDRLEVIVIDDGSTDKTLKILQEIRRSRFPGLKIITQSWKGKSAAENKGLQSSKGEIVVVSDADLPLNSNSLMFMAEDFQDTEVGGVTGLHVAKDSLISFNLDMASYARRLENEIDSRFGMSGSFVSFRKSIISKIDEGIMASDVDAAIIVRKKGYKVVHDQRIISHVNQWVEGHPRSMASAVKKLKHMFFGHIQLLLRHNDILFRNRYGLYGWIIGPRYLLSALFAFIPFMLLSVNFAINLVKSGLVIPFLAFVVLFLVVAYISRQIAPSSTISKALNLVLIYAVYYYAEFFYFLIFILRPNERRGVWG